MWIEAWKGGRCSRQGQTKATHQSPQPPEESAPPDDACTKVTTASSEDIDVAFKELEAEDIAEVPTVRICLVQPLRLLPHQGASVQAKLDPVDCLGHADAVMLEPEVGQLTWHAEDAVLGVDQEGITQVHVFNPTGCPCVVNQGTKLGEAKPVMMIQPQTSVVTKETQVEETAVSREIYTDKSDVLVQWISKSSEAKRKQRLTELVGRPEQLDDEQTRELHEFLSQRHEVFCLEEDEWGETNMITLEIDTGEERSRRPFAVWTEVAK